MLGKEKKMKCKENKILVAVAMALTAWDSKKSCEKRGRQIKESRKSFDFCANWRMATKRKVFCIGESLRPIDFFFVVFRFDLSLHASLSLLLTPRHWGLCTYLHEKLLFIFRRSSSTSEPLICFSLVRLLYMNASTHAFLIRLPSNSTVKQSDLYFSFWLCWWKKRAFGQS